MEAKYTKGEWKVANHGVSRLHIAVNPENPIETTSICSLYGSGREEEIQANAKLIAAAPDMLESLKELLRFKAELRHVMGDKLASPENFLKAIEVAEKVIEKVTE